MDGVLIVDKPEGLTSHDVVVAARRTLSARRVGHTGTLDPLATGVLPLALGRATRLVRFLSATNKDYEATIRFGVTTDSYDITGTETSRTDAAPSREALLDALASLCGDYLQTPPVYSAKRVDGHRAYALARRDQDVVLAPVAVHVETVDLLDFDGRSARVALTCSAGFYVRAFAHALGEQTGTGACLEALRRTRSGDFALEDAVPMQSFSDPAGLCARIRPLGTLMPGFPAVIVSDRGRDYVSHGRVLGASEYEAAGEVAEGWVRLLDGKGSLIGLATPGTAPGSLLPSIVLT